MQNLPAKSDMNKTMSSREIAELTSKNHKDVLRDIRTLENQGAITGRNFALSEYRDASGKSNPEYHLDFDATMTLVTGYNAMLRAKVIHRWRELEEKERSVALPQTYEEALEELLKRVKEERILREQNAALLADNTRLEKSNFDKSLKIAHDRGNVQFALAVRQSESTCLVGTLANYLKQNGYKTGPVKFFEYLRNEGWLSKQKGEAWNRPTKKAMDAGFFKIKMNAYTKGQGEEIGVSHTPVLTMKGMQFFVQKLLSQTLDNPLTDSASGSEK